MKDTQHVAANIRRTAVKTNKKKEIQNENRLTSAVVDSGATSTVGKPGDNFIPTDKLSHKVFEIPTG